LAENTFDYAYLGDVDLTFKPIPTNNYLLQVLGAGLKTVTFKRDTPEENEGQIVKLQFAVVDDPEYAGRRLFETVFPGSGGLRNLRRLMDATGVAQEETETIGGWLERLQDIKPFFNVLVQQKQSVRSKVPQTDEHGNPVMENTVVWKEATPAT
jgi:hypothetical protein